MAAGGLDRHGRQCSHVHAHGDGETVEAGGHSHGGTGAATASAETASGGFPGRPDAAGIYLATLDGRPPTRLRPDVSRGLYLPGTSGSLGALRDGGWLVWLRTDMLVAQRLDLAKPALAAEPVSVDDDVELASV